MSRVRSATTAKIGETSGMAQHFGAYSQYYDLLYADKDYVGEAKYVHALLQRIGGGVESVLELGCGTACHAALLAAAGLDVVGVEISETMHQQAQARAAEFKQDSTAGSFEVHRADARSFCMDRRFDAVISLFHVVSYQTTNQDVSRLFATASDHLKPGGVFLFDVWYGPAVAAIRPAVRVKRMENDQVSVLRIAEPELDVNRNLVIVNYTILITDKTTGAVTQLMECHPMRYFFAPEIELLADQHGLNVVHEEEWMTSKSPSDATWGVCFLARAQGSHNET